MGAILESQNQRVRSEADMAEVTIVIPNYNGKKYIKGCLDSLAGERELTEVLIVDNGSQDGSYEQICVEYPWVHCIRLEENTGFCHAVNLGLQTAQTPFCILLNNDTEVRPGFVKALLDAIKKDERTFAVSAQMLQWDRHDLLDDAGDRYCALGWAFARGKGKPAEEYNQRTEVFAACGGASIYRKSVFEEIGWFDEAHFAYLEDIDIGYRARLYGYRSYYEPKAQVLHAGSASSGSRYNEFKTRLSSANNVYLIGKNMPLLQWIWNLPLLIPGFAIKTLFFAKKKMGILYLKGLWNGIRKCCSTEGRRAKVRFQVRRLPHYIAVQGQLYLNIVRFVTKK